MANRNFLFVDNNCEYVEEALSITTSGGSGDAGKLVTTDADGKFDISLLPDSVINGVDWKDSARVSAETNIAIATAPASIDGITLVSGDRVLLAGQTLGEENGIYIFNGSGAAMTRSTDADTDAEVTPQLRVGVEEGTRSNQVAYVTNSGTIVVGTTPITLSFQNPSALVAGDGIDITGGTISVDLAASDSGLEFNSGELQIDFADTSITGDLDGTNGEKAARVEDLFGTGAAQGANIIGSDSTGIAQSSATTVQGILNDLSTAISNAGSGVEYTAAAGGVSAGDLVFVSSADTANGLDVTTAEYGIGLALTTVTGGATFTAAANDVVIPGALSGATPGQKFFWTNSGLSTTAPSGSGERVWLAGIAKNATDLQVEVRFIKKNA